MRIWKDDRGLYIKDRFGGTNHYRPGGVNGYDHAYRMDDGGLKEGDKPKTHHVSGAPLVKIRHGDITLYWATEDCHTQHNNRVYREVAAEHFRN
jgi:hypothetical protein